MVKKLYDFNISYSSISGFSCQRRFYYCYIAKVPGKPGIEAYGNAGNVVHSVLETNYFKPIEETKDLFSELWESKNLHTTNKGMFGHMLKKPVFWNAILNGLARKYDIIRTEEKLQMQDSYLIKGFIDVIAKPHPDLVYDEVTNDKSLYEDIIVVDWKTNSKLDEGHAEQMKFYAYLWFRKYGKLPKKFIWEYIKIGQRLERTMTMKDVLEVADKIKNFITEIHSKKSFADWLPHEDGKKTNCSNGACFFCEYQARCRNANVGLKDEEFNLILKKGKIYVNNPTTEMFDRIIDNYFSYEVDNKEFVIRACAKKGIVWDGIVHMKKYGSYPIGLLAKLKYYISQYADATGKNCTITVTDERKQFSFEPPMDRPLQGFELRHYQLAAVDTALRNKMGIIAVPTSGGKTLIAAEMYRRQPVTTLFVVDRKLLLTQTMKELETALDMKDKIGTISGGQMDIRSNLTIATIQTINSRVKKKDKEMLQYLTNVEMIISDEAHIAKAGQYNNMFAKAPNAKYRFGLTGTPADDATNALELHKNMGYVIYKIPIQQLIEEGTVMKPTIKFMKYDVGFIMEGDFNDTQEQLLNHEKRNEMIVNTCIRNFGKVTMLLVHRIAHGNKLKELLTEAKVESFFIQGSVNEKLREEILSDARSGHPRVLIGTSSIVSKGLNLKSLEVIINATGNATSIMTIQSLGRVLRVQEGKESATFYDFYDDVAYFKEHTEQRIKAFEKEGHKVDIIE